MTVKELIEILQLFPEDCIISLLNEGDTYSTEVKEILQEEEPDYTNNKMVKTNMITIIHE